MSKRKRHPPHEWSDYCWRCARCGALGTAVPHDSPCLTDGELAERKEWEAAASAAAKAMRRVK